ncbi:hypothetical protein NM208_g1713 [Fusarium decemcellulare]|uniref:Uncharacterized protein n=1 Tax=Fusarium decemcellulare TaxID=57161 RepID=A0ACC1SV83_9HYPO|nr:hypothetical protein NM208_g1713 [Fusarium decemcellulare]
MNEDTAGVGAIADVANIALFGLKLSNTLEILLEGYSTMTRKDLSEFLSHLYSTAESLRTIHELLEKDDDATVPIFREAGRREISRIATICQKIYSIIVWMLNTASESFGKDSKRPQMSVDALTKLPLKLTKLGSRRALSPENLDWMGVARCQMELKRYKFDLVLLHLLGQIAEYQLQHPTRVTGSFEEEQALRNVAEKVARRRARYTAWFEQKLATMDCHDTNSAVSQSQESLQSGDNASISMTEPCDEETSPPSQDGTIKIACALGHVDLEDNKDDSPKQETSSEEVVSVAPSSPKTLVNLDPVDLPQPSMSSLSISKIKDEAQDSTKDGTKDDIENPVSKADSTQATGPRSRLIPAWIRRLFSGGSSAGSEDDELEAVLLELVVSFDKKPKKTLMRLEMDSEQVKDSLARLAKRRLPWRQDRLMDQYKSLEPRVRKEVDEAVKTAKKWTTKSKDWIAIDMVTPSAQQDKTRILANPFDVSMILFFRVGKEVEPLHVTDWIDRELNLPYEHCRTWEATQSILLNMAGRSIYAKNLISSGQFDICTLDGTVITRDTWVTSVRPGMNLKIRKWYGPPPGMVPPGVTPPKSWGMPIRNTVSVSSRASTSSTSVSTASTSNEEKLAAASREIEALLSSDGNWTRTTATAKLGLGELLVMWTYAPDTHVEDHTDSDSTDSWCSTTYSSSEVED